MKNPAVKSLSIAISALAIGAVALGTHAEARSLRPSFNFARSRPSAPMQFNKVNFGSVASVKQFLSSPQPTATSSGRWLSWMTTTPYGQRGWSQNIAGRAVLGASDIRLKRDIVALGRLDDGLVLYRFRYNWSDQVYVGVMAQEVAAVVPAAVVRGPDGYLLVDYARLGLRMQTWSEWSAANGDPRAIAN